MNKIFFYAIKIVALIILGLFIKEIVMIIINNGIKKKRPDGFTLWMWRLNEHADKKKFRKYCEYYWMCIDRKTYGIYFKDWHQLYKEIYNFYYEQFRNGNKNSLMALANKKRDIKLSINSFKTIDFNGQLANFITIFAMIVSSIFGGMFSAIFSNSSNFNFDEVIYALFTITANLIVIVYIFNRLGTWLSNDRLKNFHLICLDILNEIENEILESKAKQKNEINRKELLEQIKQHIDDNNIIKNTVLPAMVEIAATTVVKKNIIGKLLGKIKRK